MFQNKLNYLSDKLELYERVSKEMSTEIKDAISKLTDFTSQIASLVTKQDARIELLRQSMDEKKAYYEKLDKAIKELETNYVNKYEKLENSIKESYNKIDTLIKIHDEKILELKKAKDIGTFILIGSVTMLSIFASAGWLSPPSKYKSSSDINNETIRFIVNTRNI